MLWCVFFKGVGAPIYREWGRRLEKQLARLLKIFPSMFKSSALTGK